MSTERIKREGRLHASYDFFCRRARQVDEGFSSGERRSTTLNESLPLLLPKRTLKVVCASITWVRCFQQRAGFITFKPAVPAVDEIYLRCACRPSIEGALCSVVFARTHSAQYFFLFFFLFVLTVIRLSV